MARGINKVILVGNLGRDPETRYMPSGGAVTNAALATSEGWKDKMTGESKERTEWHNLVFYNKLGEIAGQYLRKGSKIYAEGSLRTRKWQDKSGQDRYTTEIIVNEMQMLDSRGAGAQGGGFQQQQQAAPAPAMGHQPQQQQQQSMAPQQQPVSQPAPSYEPEMPAMNEFDDDIPF